MKKIEKEKQKNNFTKLTHKRGISLIVLIVTIIVIIILAAVVVLTITKNNPVESAKESTFKEDVRNFQDELAITVAKEYTDKQGQRDQKISTSDFDKITNYIPSFTEKYKDKFVIVDDQIVGTDKLTEEEKIWANDLSLVEKNILPYGYTELEYIESTGTQYIDINHTIQNLPITVETNFQLTSILSQNLFATSYSFGGQSEKNVYFVPYISDGKFKFDNFELEQAYIEKWYNASFIQSSSNLSNMEIKLNDNIYQVKTNILKLPINSGFQLFSASNRFFAYYKCRYFKLYENDKIIFNLIPALDVSKKPCMYDTVTKQTFYNQGTGEFLYKEKEN